MVPRFIACLLTALVLGASAQVWRDTVTPPALRVSHNATGALRVGDVVELNCTAEGMMDTTTLEWTLSQGHIMTYLYPRGRSPLTQQLAVTAELHGAELVCSAPYSETDANQRITKYTIFSDRVKLEVEGGSNTVVPNLPGSAEMVARPAAAAYGVGELVAFVCTTYDLSSTVLDMVIAKGKEEIQLHTGWQPVRQLTLNVTAAEHGTEMYCLINTISGRDVYVIASNRVPIHVEV